jgi:hypothetical protein
MPLVNYGSNSVENNMGVFSYQKSTFNGDQAKPCPYVEVDRRKPGRWNGKQLNAGRGKGGHNESAVSRCGLPGTLSQDCLFEPTFNRLFEGDGETKCAPSHLPPTNTIETARMKEKIHMELETARKSASAVRLQTAQSELETSRRESLSRLAETPAPVFEVNDMRSRKYRPTASSAIGARHNNHYTAIYNEQMYLPAVHGMPAAYKNSNSHAPLIMGKTGDGFFRKQGSMAGTPY